MDAKIIEKLLIQDEGSNLDFKSEIDLESKRGKADFLVEVLGLANSSEKPAYLIIGVEDKTKKVKGISADITEERLQKVIADNCRPSLHCAFEYASYKRKQIGILTIRGNQRPYTLKKDMGFEEERGKPRIISDKTVFVRRGSTGDTATPEEIAEMFFEWRESQNSPQDHDNFSDELDGISTDLYHINNSIDRINERGKRERAIEYLSIGIISGLLIGLLQALGLDWKIYISGIFIFTFWVSVLASVLKIVRFGWVRSALVSLAVSVTFVTFSVLSDSSATKMLSSMGLPSMLLMMWGGIKGMAGGIVAAYFGKGEYEYD